MKKIILLFAWACFLTSCNVTESLVFNKDGSGQFLVTYDMGDAVKAMAESMGGASTDKKEGGEVMDTTMVFAEIVETYKDSVAALPEEKRLAMEAVKDMFMNMKVDEAKGIMDFGIGLNFDSIDDLKGISEKIKKAQSLNAQNDQIGAMKENSPIGNFMGGDNDVAYNITDNGFSRFTNLTVSEESTEDAMDELFDETDEENQQFMDYFKNAYYNVELTFPRPVKYVSVEGAEISKDGKTVTYKANWIDYLKNPLLLDVKVDFADE